MSRRERTGHGCHHHPRRQFQAAQTERRKQGFYRHAKLRKNGCTTATSAGSGAQNIAGHQRWPSTIDLADLSAKAAKAQDSRASTR
ncbi:hypothetical protein ALP68_101779 [Pseudomonas ficuserectae]|uniref:Uncharacterized protein n=7 Tax=Pseudomonas syringae group TaxID=136849 RepID=A0A0P9WEU2_PSEA0|nr:hypothetical protein ALO90_101917 [Pseudomonas amygdali pv. aesculi]KPW82543.1 hypothetical protein ALO50_102169 [Pseudomonas syringae pv. cerasicola]KPX25033.1 hypothetical protein ALO70_101824 [Pseudomonas amygdali pv. eriobotryae]KPX38778.1 hypothetical protein ALO69_102016 [Pseudomonas ficuserectae]KPY00323.1 hypothetical protein ALO63_101923 [Pseudomonas amygdali pv. mori]KPY12025.1 hypothetical protein ALO55_101964 [Pseudomonas savastanoi pv. phaseolicola]RMM65756.1 hypothetical prot